MLVASSCRAFFAPHDRPLVLFSPSGPSHPPQHRILARPSLVVGIFYSVERCLILYVSFGFPSPRFSCGVRCGGGVGYGAVWKRQRFYCSWSFLSLPASITFLELVPVVVAAHVWGQSWVRSRVQFLSDNAAVVAILNKGSSKFPDVMHLLRILTRVACRHSFVFPPVMFLVVIIALLTLCLVFRLRTSFACPRMLARFPPDFQVLPVATVPSDLVSQCYRLLSHGLAPSTRRTPLVNVVIRVFVCLLVFLKSPLRSGPLRCLLRGCPNMANYLLPGLSPSSPFTPGHSPPGSSFTSRSSFAYHQSRFDRKEKHN